MVDLKCFGNWNSNPCALFVAEPSIDRSCIHHIPLWNRRRQQKLNRIARSNLLFRDIARQFSPPENDSILNPVPNQRQLTPDRSTQPNLLLATVVLKHPPKFQRSPSMCHRPLDYCVANLDKHPFHQTGCLTRQALAAIIQNKPRKATQAPVALNQLQQGCTKCYRHCTERRFAADLWDENS